MDFHDTGTVLGIFTKLDKSQFWFQSNTRLLNLIHLLYKSQSPTTRHEGAWGGGGEEV
jgi:hypothetical protein